MPIFQPSVLKSHIALLDHKAVDKAYKQFARYFLDPKIQENIKVAKEEQYQATFLTELFVKILGYTLFPDTNYNLVTEQKNEGNSRKADGAILKGDAVTAVIELKGTKTKDLESIRKQAFDYKNFNTGCNYVITSNFEKLRFYIDDASTFEEFDLFTLSRKRFQLLYLCINKEQLLQHTPKSIKEESLVEEEKITKSFYKDYSLFKRELWKDLAKNNVTSLKQLAAQHRSVQNELAGDATAVEEDDLNKLEKNVKRTLFKKSQKLIDRFLFIFFAEDRGLLQPNYTLKSIEEWETVRKLGVEETLYDRFKKHFNYLDQGRKKGDGVSEIFAYNGGLFKPDTILDHIVISDDLLLKHTKKIAAYDFESQVDVNILGHIFENSLNEIESVNAEIDGADFDKQTSKRKKDGVFYTPKYITKYIVDNTVGKLCEEKKTELGFAESEYYRGRKNRNKSTLENLVKILDDYREWLLQLTICDPACGSGAFLNQALDFLITEHNYIDELKSKLFGTSMILSDIENTILENNIYGVDLNEESVEIAKLSLWLRTAQPRRKLNDLSSNIKCGNSLIDVKAVAGDKAFKWEEEFPQVFEKGGFDVVIGNPPYGAKISSKEIDFVKSRFDKHMSGEIETYIVFYLKGMKLLSQRGVLGFITPDTWLTISRSSSLRNSILTNHQILDIHDWYKPFKDAKDTRCHSTILRNTPTKKIEAIKISLSNFKGEVIDDFYINQENINHDEKWQVYVNPKRKLIYTKILSNCTTIGEQYFLKYGLRTGNNSKYLTKNKDLAFTNYKIARGSHIERYNFNWIPEYLITEVDLPISYFQEKIIASNKLIIQYVRTNSTDSNAHWLEAAVIKETGFVPLNSTSFFIEENKFYSLELLLAIFSNDLMNKYYRDHFTDVNIKPAYLQELPLPILEFETKNLNSKVNVIQDLTDKKNQILKRFETFIIDSSKIFSNNKLKSWHELDFGDFIKELNKAINAQNRKRKKEAVIDLEDPSGQMETTPYQVIPELTKKDEFEWMELFEEKKKEVLELQSQINQTEKEIDQMVYELYGLTDEEIKIVEES